MSEAVSRQEAQRKAAPGEAEPGEAAAQRLEVAVAAARLLAVDPAGIGGVVIRSQAGPVRDVWLRALRAMLPDEAPWVRVPLHVGEDRLLGGLDLTATLAAGRPVAERGLLAAADGGVLVLAMAERLASSTVSAVTAAMDQGTAVVERDGLTLRHAARFGVVALDEGIAEDEGLVTALADRLAFRLDLAPVAPRDAMLAEAAIAADGPEAVLEARARLKAITIDEAIAKGLASTAMALGIDSLRAILLAMRVARAAAALEGRTAVGEAEARLAAGLVLGPRATQLPAPPENDEEAEESPPPPDQPPPPENEMPHDPPEPQSREDQPEQMPDLDDIILAAAAAAIPPGLLATLQLRGNRRGPARAAGKAGHLQKAKKRGRPLGSRRGQPRGGNRLALVDTLRVAAPWQPLRRRERAPANDTDAQRRVEVRPDDLRVTRFKQRTETTVIFVVDASGSTAFARLAEAKGAVELLLADCYVRRESVALISFRGAGAELLLPPTRSLTRAKRSLAGLPGGGGTPLAAGLDAALALAQAAVRKGQTPILVLLSDGRGNVARDGQPGRSEAEADATEAGLAMRQAGLTALFVDTSARPQAKARELAAVMGARYLALPRADAQTLSKAVKAGTAGLRAAG